MKKMNKKLISILLAVVMVFATMSIGLTAFADGEGDGSTSGDSSDSSGSHVHQFESIASTPEWHIKRCIAYGTSVCPEGGDGLVTEDHVFGDNPDGTCTVCKYYYDCLEKGHYVRDVNSFDDHYHVVRCSACGASWREKHNFVTVGDITKCTTCSYVYTGCDVDKGTHYLVDNGDGTHSCMEQHEGAISNAPHEFNYLGFCKGCGFYSCEEFGHSYIGGYFHNKINHWKTCENCGDIIQLEEHVDENENGVCDVCYYEMAHRWQLISGTSPTCFEDGGNTYECVYCHQKRSESVPALGHYWYDDTNESTHTYVTMNFSEDHESCTITFKCRRPGCNQTVSYTVYTDKITDFGQIEIVEKVILDENGDPLLDYSGNPITAKVPRTYDVEATCEAGSGIAYIAHFNLEKVVAEMGLERANYTCIETIEDGNEPATGHDFTDPSYEYGGENYNGTATCTKNGTRTVRCKGSMYILGTDENGNTVLKKVRCNVEKILPDPAHGHDVATYETTKQPTCDEEGTKTGICTRCGETVTQPVAALGHDWVEDESAYVAPTCLKEGLKTYACSRCEETKTESVPALGHNLGDWVTYKDAVCDKDRVERRYCSRCDYYEEREIPGSAPGHSYKYEYIDENRHGLVCETCGSTAGRSEAHIDADYNFVCDYCNHELDFWHHWMHYMVGLPTYGFSGFTNMVMTFFTKMVNFFTQYMINF